MSRLLQECGHALYGQQWQSALARDLGVSDRTMRRWAARVHPARVDAELRRLMLERLAVLEELVARLAEAPRA